MKLNTIINILAIFSFTFVNAQIDYSEFKGEKIKTSLEVNLENSHFKQYGSEFMQKYIEINIKNKKNTLNTPENTLISYYSASNKESYKEIFKGDLIKISSNKLKNRKKSDTLQNAIRFIHRLTFDYKNKPVTFFKYKLLKDSILSAPKLLVMEKQADNSWIIIINSSFESTKYAIKHITSKGFWQFISNHDDVKYPEINKLKPLVQDSNGILDIEKLGQVIKNNQTTLKKYLDN